MYNNAGKGLRMDLYYGPDQERWCSELSRNGTDVRTTVYAGEYEKITENGTTREYYYLDGNTIVVKENGVFKNFLAFTDNIGSILSVIYEDGAKVFDASYDAWGRQTVTRNTIGLHRGYTGHEMLSEFDIINMNGRLYDPVLGRFFSPDNFVQMPDNSQNFNRYSYCLNNPLKYTDPSGNLFGIDDAVIAFAVFNMANSMMQAAYEGKSVWKAGAYSLLSSAVTYGIGEAFKGAANTFGNELLRAGAHGLSSGVFSALDGGNFASAFVSGATASGMGSYAQAVSMNTGLMIASTTAMGGAVAWLTGGEFLQGAMNGMQIAILNHSMHDGDNDQTYTVQPDGSILLNEVVVKGHYNGHLPLMTVIRFAETINSTISEFYIITSKGKYNGYILERGGPDTNIGGQKRRIPNGIYDMDYTDSPRFKRKLYLIHNSDVSEKRGVRLHEGNYYTHSTACLLPGANYNFNNSTNAYEVFNSKQALKKIENLLDGNKTRLVIINNIP